MSAPDEWPALTYESLDWLPTDLPDSGASPRTRRREVAQYAGPYQAAVTPSIARLSYRPAPDTVVAITDAEAEIARFDAELGAEIAPFSSVLLRTEAAASSQIEHLTSSAKAIELALLGSTGRGNATLIARNTIAMRAALGLADSLTEESVLRMHEALLGGHDPQHAGRWRDCQVWIGTSSRTPIGADFVAPHHDRVPAGMADLIGYVGRDDVPVLQQVAIAHAQFETIHPFHDGNGRVGRALMHALLRGKGLTRNVTVPVSAGLLTDVAGYHRALTAYRDGRPDPIIRLTADASMRAVANGRVLVAELREVRADWTARVTARSDSAIWRVVDLALRQPVLTLSSLEAELGLSAKNAHRHLAPLEAAGVLKRAKLDKLSSYWAAGDVLAALDRFADRAGRRGS